MIYRYDGSYPGFLCCVFESFVRKALPLAIEGPETAQLSFFEGREIPTEAKKLASSGSVPESDTTQNAFA